MRLNRVVLKSILVSMYHVEKPIKSISILGIKCGLPTASSLWNEDGYFLCQFCAMFDILTFDTFFKTYYDIKNYGFATLFGLLDYKKIENVCKRQ